MPKLILLQTFFALALCVFGVREKSFRVVGKNGGLQTTVAVPTQMLQKHHVIPRPTLLKIHEMLSNADDARFNTIISTYFDGVSNVSPEDFVYLNINLFEGPKRSHRFNDPATEGIDIDRPLLAVPYFAVDAYPISIQTRYPEAVQSMRELWVAAEEALVLYLSCYENPKQNDGTSSNRQKTMYGAYRHKMRNMDQIENLFIAMDAAFWAWREAGKSMNFRWDDPFSYTETDWIAVGKKTWTMSHEHDVIAPAASEPEIEVMASRPLFEYIGHLARDKRSVGPKEGYLFWNTDWEVYPAGYYSDNLEVLRRKDGVQFKLYAIRSTFRKFQLLRLWQIGLDTKISGYARSHLEVLMRDSNLDDILKIDEKHLIAEVNAAAYELAMVFQFFNETPHEYCDSGRSNEVIWTKALPPPPEDLVRVEQLSLEEAPRQGSTTPPVTAAPSVADAAWDDFLPHENAEHDTAARLRSPTMSSRAERDPMLVTAIKARTSRRQEIKKLLMRRRTKRKLSDEYDEYLSIQSWKNDPSNKDIGMMHRRLHNQIAFANETNEDNFIDAAEQVFFKSCQISLFFILREEYNFKMFAAQWKDILLAPEDQSRDPSRGMREFARMGGNVQKRKRDEQSWNDTIHHFDGLKTDIEQMQVLMDDEFREYVTARSSVGSWSDYKDNAKKLASAIRQFHSLVISSVKFRNDFEMKWIKLSLSLTGNDKAACLYAVDAIEKKKESQPGLDTITSTSIFGRFANSLHIVLHPENNDPMDFTFTFYGGNPNPGLSAENNYKLSTTLGYIAMKYTDDPYEAAAKSVDWPTGIGATAAEIRKKFEERLGIIRSWLDELVEFVNVIPVRRALKDIEGTEYDGVYTVKMKEDCEKLTAVTPSLAKNGIYDRYFKCSDPDNSYEQTGNTVTKFKTKEPERLSIKKACNEFKIPQTISVESANFTSKNKKKGNKRKFVFTFRENFDNVIKRIEALPYSEESKKEFVHKYRREKALHDVHYGNFNNSLGSGVKVCELEESDELEELIRLAENYNVSKPKPEPEPEPEPAIAISIDDRRQEVDRVFRYIELSKEISKPDYPLMDNSVKDTISKKYKLFTTVFTREQLVTEERFFNQLMDFFHEFNFEHGWPPNLHVCGLDWAL